jgi:hypothetical protein
MMPTVGPHPLRDQYHGKEKLIPEVDEVQDDRRRDRRHTDRECQPPEDVQIGAAVDLRCIKEILRELREESLEEVHRQRELDRDVDQGQTRSGIEQAVLDENLEQRDDDYLRRENDGAEDHEVDQSIAPEAVSGEAMGRLVDGVGIVAAATTALFK